ncbi:MAG: DUF1800 domain-containing protein [Chloroflexi bacterium]|nr:DUF1800 domain-containing protein [Chloroflexota bacterium]
MALATERQRIQHLLRRAGFGYSPEELGEYLALGLEGSVDRLLHPERVDDSAAEAVAAAFRERALRDVKIGRAGENRQALQATWHARLLLTRRPLLEKLTYFWHDHWATGVRKVANPSYMLRQNEGLRAGALGSFRDMALALTRDPAMMVWLDNRNNVGKAPNENYAREFLELFTLGEGVLYTEQDVQETARAFTGWRITAKKPTPESIFPIATGVVFTPRQWDAGTKTVLGFTGKFGDEDIIRIVTSRRECADHVGAKLWRFFAVPEPTAAMIARTTDAYLAHDTSIREMVRVILLSPEMYSDAAYRWRMKSPVEYVVQTSRALGLTSRTAWVGRDTKRQGQTLFDPPSVAGWNWGEAWINSNTLLARANFANEVTRRGKIAQNLDAAELLKAHGATRTAAEAVDFALDLIVGGDVDPETRATLIEHLGGAHFDFQQANRSGALQGLFYLVLTMPLAQLG